VIKNGKKCSILIHPPLSIGEYSNTTCSTQQHYLAVGAVATWSGCSFAWQLSLWPTPFLTDHLYWPSHDLFISCYTHQSSPPAFRLLNPTIHFSSLPPPPRASTQQFSCGCILCMADPPTIPLLTFLPVCAAPAGHDLPNGPIHIAHMDLCCIPCDRATYDDYSLYGSPTLYDCLFFFFYFNLPRSCKPAK
jgi:hypothetical protein